MIFLRRGFLGEIVAIYKDFGVAGFYRGIVPKLVGETCQTLAVGALAYLVSNQAPAAEVRSLLNVSFSVSDYLIANCKIYYFDNLLWKERQAFPNSLLAITQST